MGNLLCSVPFSLNTTVYIFQNQDSLQHNCHTIIQNMKYMLIDNYNQTWNSFTFSNYQLSIFYFLSKMPPRIMLCI